MAGGPTFPRPTVEDPVVPPPERGRVQLFVANGDRVVLDTVAGSEGPQPVDRDTPLPVLCAGKPFLSVAIGMLWERGDLDVAHPVARYLPGLGAGEQVTLWHLLTHTGGLAPDSQPPLIGRWEDVKAAALAVGLRDDWVPGYRARYDEYCSSVLLAAVLESVSGSSYQEFLHGEIIEVLGLAGTSFVPLPDTAGIHVWDDDHGRYNLLVGGANPLSPGTGMVSTARDLGRFYQSLLPGAPQPLLSQVTVTAMGSHQRVRIQDERDGSFAGHGLGFELDFMTIYDRRISHRSFGYGGVDTARAWLDPEQGIVVAMVFDVQPAYRLTPKAHQSRFGPLARVAYDAAGSDGRERPAMRSAEPALSDGDGPGWWVMLSRSAR